MARMHWNAHDLADNTGVSPKTIERMLAGGYIRKANAEDIQEAARQDLAGDVF